MRPYEPAKLPLENLDYQMLFSVVGNANAELARYDGLLQGIVNPSVMLSPLTMLKPFRNVVLFNSIEVS